jgi:hypothetical protein
MYFSSESALLATMRFLLSDKMLTASSTHAPESPQRVM